MRTECGTATGIKNIFVMAAIAAAVVGLSGASVAAADDSPKTSTYSLDIPAQSLSDALQALALASGHRLVYSSEIVDGRSAPAVKGEYTTAQAVERLLAGTRLVYEVTADGLVVIRGRDAREKPSATSSNVGQAAGGMRVAQSSSASASQRENAQGADERSDQSASKSTDAQVGEIIVTAQKRSERIQDVPMSITAITAEEIDKRGMVNAEDYLRGIPGVNQVGDSNAYAGQAIVIRGIVTSTMNSQNFSSGATVATYFGETPTTGSSGTIGSNIDIKLIDIDRVEVLRGPQGTAFGSSALGGVVRTIPVAPKLDRFEAKVGTGYSQTSGVGGDNYNIRAVGNIALIDNKLGIRATAYRFHDSGFYRNEARSNAAFLAAITPYGGVGFASDAQEVGSSSAIGGRIAALFQASDDLRFSVTYLRQETELDGQPLANSGSYEQTLLQVAPEHVYRGMKAGLNDTDIELVSGTAEYDFGWSDLVATYSNVSGGNLFSVPLGLAGLSYPGSFAGPITHREYTSEVRLSTKLDGRWNFLAGAYVESLRDLYVYDVIWSGDPATNIFEAGKRSLFDYRDTRHLKQKAAFGEASLELLAGLTLTGGVRSYKYDRTVGVNQSGTLAGGVTSSKVDNVEASGENLRANLSYKYSDASLVYAGWSQGFRLGKPQPGVPAAICDQDGNGVIDGTNVTIASTGLVGDDSVDSYELGGKFTLLDRRLSLSAAVFRMDWTNIPVSVRYESCGYLQSVNAGKARSNGIELQADLALSDVLRIDVGGSLIDAELIEDVPAQGFVAGDPLPGAPRVNANMGVERNFALGGRQAFVRADAIYVGPFHGDIRESPNTAAGDYVKLDVSARVEVGNLDIDLFVRNLTDEDAFAHRGSGLGQFYGHRMRPRTIGFQLGYDF